MLYLLQPSEATVAWAELLLYTREVSDSNLGSEPAQAILT